MTFLTKSHEGTILILTMDELQSRNSRVKPPRIGASGKGYAVIDEKALGNLPAEAYYELGRCGALALAFAQVFSLARLRELQGRETAWQRQHQSLSDADLAHLMGDDDTLKFDF